MNYSRQQITPLYHQVLVLTTSLGFAQTPAAFLSRVTGASQATRRRPTRLATPGRAAGALRGAGLDLAGETFGVPQPSTTLLGCEPARLSWCQEAGIFLLGSLHGWLFHVHSRNHVVDAPRRIHGACQETFQLVFFPPCLSKPMPLLRPGSRQPIKMLLRHLII